MNLPVRFNAQRYDPCVAKRIQKIEAKRKAVMNSSLLKSLSLDQYSRMLKARLLGSLVQGLEVEVAGAGSVFKEIHPHLLVTDNVKARGVDYAIDFCDMDFENNSLACIYGVDMFYKLRSPKQFLSEVQRTLKTDGLCILVEPHHGVLSKYLGKKIVDKQVYDREQIEWLSAEWPETDSGVYNRALPYISFVRDRAKLESELGNLSIVSIDPLPNMLSSVTHRFECFAVVSPLIKLIDTLLSPFRYLLATHQLIVIRKSCP